MMADEIKHDLEVICPKITKTTGCNDGTICADCIADCLKAMRYCKGETLLKEFVEYLKSTKKYQAIDEDTDTRGTSWGKRYTLPHHQLDLDLEKFWEEYNGK